MPVASKVKTYIILLALAPLLKCVVHCAGGVLGFWGGVGSMGTVFLLVVLTQRYCCRRRHDKEEAGG